MGYVKNQSPNSMVTTPGLAGEVVVGGCEVVVDVADVAVVEVTESVVVGATEVELDERLVVSAVSGEVVPHAPTPRSSAAIKPATFSFVNRSAVIVLPPCLGPIAAWESVDRHPDRSQRPRMKVRHPPFTSEGMPSDTVKG